jgi:glucose-1-phosphate thymidylyltransferase
MDLRGVIVVEEGVSPEGDPPRSVVPATEHVANRPIAHHVLDALEAAGVEDVVVASSARSARAVRCCMASREQTGRVRLQFVERAAPLELASALSLVAPIVEDSACIVHSAGGMLAEPLAPLAACLDDGADAVLMVHQTSAPEQRLSVAVQNVLHLAELDPTRSTLGVAGVWAFGPGTMRSAAATSDADSVDLSAVAERITSAGGTIQVRLADIWRSYRGEPVDLLELNRIALDRLEIEPRRPASDGNVIEGRVWIHEQASVQSSVIVGPTVIAAGAYVANAYIGPYTSIGAGAHIEGAEIERSIIASGASVTHVGDRLTASVVGRNARVSRDFSLPRALRLSIGPGAEIALC